MRVVSYTRATSCYPGEVVPKDVISQLNQHIKDYADSRGWRITSKYSDRKIDSSENSDFERLLSDGVRRMFDIVIVDSVFRAGKDLWTAKEVLLETFHYAGIPFIAVEDGFDSSGKTVKEVEAYFDEKYGIFRHEYIRNKVNQRNRDGILSWNDMKYGYKLIDNRLVIDEETAPIVRRMFQLCAEGMNPKEIATLFRSEKIPIPLATRGTKVQIEDPYKWDRSNIRRLLDKTVYIGRWTKVVQGKEMHFTNDPIVEEDVFQKVQDYLAAVTVASPQLYSKHPYSGLLLDKNKELSFRLIRQQGREWFFKYNKLPERYSSQKHMEYQYLDDTVRKKLNDAKAQAESILDRIRKSGEEAKELMIARIRAEICKRSYEVSDLRKKKMEDYLKFSHENYPKEKSSFVDSKYENELSELEKEIREQMGMIKRVDTVISEQNPWLKLFLTWDNSFSLDHTTVLKYITCVIIDKMKIVSVELREKNWYDDFPKEWRS